MYNKNNSNIVCKNKSKRHHRVLQKTLILRDFTNYCNHPRIDTGTQYTQAKAYYDRL